MKKPICLLLLLSMIWACGESVRFEQPQPVDQKALSKIPRSLRGKYISNDSTFISISRTSVVERTIYEVEEPIDSLIAEIEADDDVIITHRSKTRLKVKDLEAGIEAVVNLKDGIGTGKVEIEETLFSISENHVLKTLNGEYFFNVLRPEDTAWILRWLRLTGDSLVISKVNGTGNEDFSELLSKSGHYKKNGSRKGSKIAPDRSQLMELLKSHSKVTKVFHPIKK